AEPFVDRAADEGAVRPHGLQLVGVCEQAAEEVARRAIGGLGARGEEEAEEREDLLVGEPLPVELGVREDADHVLLRVAAARREDAGYVVAERLGGGKSPP